jgi:hypothetical protein
LASRASSPEIGAGSALRKEKKPVNGGTLGIDRADGFFQRFSRNRDAGEVLDAALKRLYSDLRSALPFSDLTWGKIHDIEIFNQVIQGFIGLLLSVTGVFAHNHVRAFQVGAHLADFESERRFDQGAGVARQQAFSTSSVAKSAPEQRPTKVALAARTISSGTNTQ